MKNIRHCCIVVVTFCSMIASGGSLYSAAGDTGAGFILGDPTGLTGKYYITGTDAVDAGSVLLIMTDFIFTGIIFFILRSISC